MKQINLLLVLFTIGLIFLFIAPSVNSNELTAEETNMNLNSITNARLEDEAGIKFILFTFKLF
jgi:hypothetical protein